MNLRGPWLCPEQRSIKMTGSCSGMAKDLMALTTSVDFAVVYRIIDIMSWNVQWVL